MSRYNYEDGGDSSFGQSKKGKGKTKRRNKAQKEFFKERRKEKNRRRDNF